MNRKILGIALVAVFVLALVPNFVQVSGEPTSQYTIPAYTARWLAVQFAGIIGWDVLINMTLTAHVTSTTTLAHFYIMDDLNFYDWRNDKPFTTVLSYTNARITDNMTKSFSALVKHDGIWFIVVDNSVSSIPITIEAGFTYTLVRDFSSAVKYSVIAGTNFTYQMKNITCDLSKFGEVLQYAGNDSLITFSIQNALINRTSLDYGWYFGNGTWADELLFVYSVNGIAKLGSNLTWIRQRDVGWLGMIAFPPSGKTVQGIQNWLGSYGNISVSNGIASVVVYSIAELWLVKFSSIIPYDGQVILNYNTTTAILQDAHYGQSDGRGFDIKLLQTPDSSSPVGLPISDTGIVYAKLPMEESSTLPLYLTLVLSVVVVIDIIAVVKRKKVSGGK